MAREKINSFKCDKCTKTFQRKWNLKTHVKGVHDKIRDHVCQECGTGFTMLAWLNKHKQLHKDIRKYACEICSYKTNDKGHLLRHVKAVHEMIRAFKCKDCDYAASRKAHLHCHVKRHHQMEKVT